MGQSKDKFKVVGSGSKLKASIGKLPDQGFEFTALRGHEKTKAGKDPGPESIGLFVDSATGSDFSKEKAKIASGQFFKGTVQRSTKDPKGRLVLVTTNSARPLLELARECLKQASVKMKVVVVKPGEAEPDSVDDDDTGTAPQPLPQQVAQTAPSRAVQPPPRPTQPLPPAKKPTPTATAPNVYKQAQVIWDGTRDKVASELRKLEDAILAVYDGDSELPAVRNAVRRLDGVLQRFDRQLCDAVDQINASGSDTERQRLLGEARKILARYEAALDNDPLLPRLDDNPFVAVEVESVLRKSVEVLAGRLA